MASLRGLRVYISTLILFTTVKHCSYYLQEIDYFAEESDHGEADNESDEEEGLGGRRIDLEILSKETHPCLVKGNFSVFNSPNVGLVTQIQEVTYGLDMDGFVVLSR
jgi:hypothetical protein